MLDDSSVMTGLISPLDPSAPAAQAGAQADSQKSTGTVLARDIGDADIPRVAALLHEGFPSKPAARFLAALDQLGRRDAVAGMPRFGYVLSAGGEIVGVLLTIATEISGQAGAHIRCNVGCWYVQPQFRLYAPLLVLKSYRNRQVTHFNIWPARHTWPTITAQGFSPLCSGTFAGVPALSTRGSGTKIRAVRPRAQNRVALPENEFRILQDHAGYGCISIVCARGGHSVPFIFRRRRFRRAVLPGAQLIFSRSMDDLASLAGPIGRYLALRGMPWILVGANEKIDGIPGLFMQGKLPIYVRGPTRPPQGDLAYTETAMFGF